MLKHNTHLKLMNIRYGLFTGSGVEPYWKVFAAQIVRKYGLMQRLKTVDNFVQLKSMLAFATSSYNIQLVSNTNLT